MSNKKEVKKQLNQVIDLDVIKIRLQVEVSNILLNKFQYTVSDFYLKNNGDFQYD